MERSAAVTLTRETGMVAGVSGERDIAGCHQERGLGNGGVMRGEKKGNYP